MRGGRQRRGSTRWEEGGARNGGTTHDPAAALPPALPSAFDCLHRRLVTGLADTLRARLPAVAHLVRVRVGEVGTGGRGERWGARANESERIGRCEVEACEGVRSGEDMCVGGREGGLTRHRDSLPVSWTTSPTTSPAAMYPCDPVRFGMSFST